MPTLPQPRFYVYVLSRPDGTPFYVGKGSGKRMFVHERTAKSGHKCYKCNVIRKIWREGGNVLYTIVFETNDEQEAFDRETHLIDLYGLKALTNLTKGGDGASGRIVSTETKEKMRSSMTPDRKIKLRVAAHTPEAKQKRSIALQQRTEESKIESETRRRASISAAWTEERKEQARVAMRERMRERGSDMAKLSRANRKPMSDEERKRRSDRATTMMLRPDVRAKNSARAKASMTPEMRQKLIDGIRRPETRKKLRDAAKVNVTPEIHARLVEASRTPEARAKRSAYWGSEDARKKQSERLRLYHARRKAEKQQGETDADE